MPQGAISIFKTKMLSTVGVMHMDQIVLGKVIGKYG